MIVCSCTMTTDKDIDRAVARLIERDAFAVLTPLRVYHALGRRPRCGACMPLFIAAVQEAGRRQREK